MRYPVGYDPKWIHDHVLPLSMGGCDTLENSQTICRKCDRQRTDKEATARAKADRLAQRHETHKTRRSLNAGDE